MRAERSGDVASGRSGPLERTVAAGLIWGRLAIGAGVWAAPRGSMELLGFDPGHPQVRALARLGGTRDLALGALALAAEGTPEREARIALANAGVDALDALAFAIALARREGIDRAGLLGTASASGAAVAGLWLARRSRRRATASI